MRIVRDRHKHSPESLEENRCARSVIAVIFLAATSRSVSQVVQPTHNLLPERMFEVHGHMMRPNGRPELFQYHW